VFANAHTTLQTPRKEMANAITLLLPARHPKNTVKVGIERMKNGKGVRLKRKNSSALDATAYNGRFGKIAALAPQQRQCELGSYYPAGSFVEAATSPSRWDVRGNAWATQRFDRARRKNNLTIFQKLCIFAFLLS